MKIKKPIPILNPASGLVQLSRWEWDDLKASIDEINSMLEDAIQFNCWSEPVVATSRNIGYRERWRPIDQFPVSDSKLIKTAFLINIQEIKPKTKGERAIELIKSINIDEETIGVMVSKVRQAKALLEESE